MKLRRQRTRRVTRTPPTCPKCGGIARPAYYRGERPAKKQAPFVRVEGKLYCIDEGRFVDG